MAAGINVPLGMEVGLGPGDFVLDRDPAPPPLQFSAYFYCGQTAGCIKMPLGIEVDLIPGDFMLHGDPPTRPQKGGGAPPQFSAISNVAKRLNASRCHLV